MINPPGRKYIRWYAIWVSRPNSLPWRAPRAIGRGLSDMKFFGDKVVLTDVAHDRLLLLDPLSGQLFKEIALGGAPRTLAVVDDGLLVGLDSAAQIVKLDWGNS